MIYHMYLIGQLSNIWKIELQFMLGNITLQMYVI